MRPFRLTLLWLMIFLVPLGGAPACADPLAVGMTEGAGPGTKALGDCTEIPAGSPVRPVRRRLTYAHEQRKRPVRALGRRSVRASRGRHARKRSRRPVRRHFGQPHSQISANIRRSLICAGRTHFVNRIIGLPDLVSEYSDETADVPAEILVEAKRAQSPSFDMLSFPRVAPPPPPLPTSGRTDGPFPPIYPIGPAPIVVVAPLPPPGPPDPPPPRSVPEPSSWLLYFCGFFLLGRRLRNQNPRALSL
jgi:hypothetical protein